MTRVTKKTFKMLLNLLYHPNIMPAPCTPNSGTPKMFTGEKKKFPTPHGGIRQGRVKRDTAKTDKHNECAAGS